MSGTAKDKAGNTATASATVNLDKTPPVLSITPPTNGATVNPGPLTVTGTAADVLSGIDLVTCQESAATISGASFTCTVSVTAGLNTITVEAADKAGNTVQATVTVQSGTPTIVSIVPNTGQQGQQNLSVAIIGQSTHFAQGTTTASFGDGITMVSLTVNSPTSATAVLHINPAALAGPRNVTLTTGAEVVSLPNGFTVQTVGAPTLMITPNTGQQGTSNLALTITGQNTHFVQGATVASFGPGISVNGAPAGQPGVVTVTSSTSATASLSIGGHSDWSLPAISGTAPPTLSRPSAVYSVTSNQFLLFGGTGGDPAYTPLYNDIWRLNNANGSGTRTWTHVTTQGISVGGRWGHNAVYDEANDRMIVFGGIIGQGYGPMTNAVLVLANASGVNGSPTWSQLNPQGNVPPPRAQVGIGYDEANNRLIIFGGWNSNITVFNDVWVLSNANGLGGPPVWTQLTPTGASPAARRNMSSGYDPGSNRLIIGGGDTVFGGYGQDSAPEFWVLTNANGSGGPSSWIHLTQPPSNFDTGSSALYDSQSNRFVFLSSSRSSCVSYYAIAPQPWILDNANGLGGAPTWTQLGPFSAMPIALLGGEGGVAYDRTTDQIFFYGGQFIVNPPNSVGVSKELWTLGNAISGSITGVRTVEVQTQAEQISLDQGFTIVPPAAAPPAVMATPSCLNVGAASTITLTGVNTNLAAGALASFGSGISVGGAPSGAFGPITVISPTLATAAIAVDSSAVQGPRDIGVRIPSGAITTSAHGFGVGAPNTAPYLMTASPASAQPGQSLTVTLTGSNTHFVQGTTEVSFGTDITVSGITVASPTSLGVSLIVSASAGLGGRTITVTTGAEIVSLANGFAVLAGALPAITTVSPNSGPQGGSGPVTIVGQNTHFAQGATQVDFGPGVAVSNIAVTCPTCLSAQLSVSPGALVGGRTVTVTTGTEVVQLANGFTVAAAPPILTSMVPASGRQGQTVMSTITGLYTHWVQGQTQVDLGAGVTVNSVTVQSATTLMIQLTVDVNATPGIRNLTVTAGTEVVSASNVFTVNVGIPVIQSVIPATGQLGQSLPITITGQFTHFAQGTSQVSFGSGITVNSVSVASVTSLTAQISITPGAALGLRTVTVTTGSEVASLPNGFTVEAGTPVLLTVGPNTGTQGQQNLSVAIAAQFTNFVQDATTASFGSGIAVNAVTVADSTHLVAQVSIASDAGVGARTVLISTGSETESLANGFTVQQGVPTLLSVNPNTVPQGQNSLSVAVTGQFTHFAQTTSSVSFGAGVTVDSITVADPTHLSAVISVAGTAALGNRTVTVTTGTEVASLSSGFAVGAGTPTLISLSPTSASQGQKNVNVTINGQFTNFAQGTSTVSFGGAGITINSVTVAGATNLVANISLALNATTGARTVTVTTGSEVVSLANSFTVQQATNQAPVITIAPAWSVTLPASLTLTYSVTDDGLPLGGALTMTWSTVSGPGTVGFQNQTVNSIVASFSQAGTYVLQISATDSQLTTTQNVTVTVAGTLPPPPTVSITSPTEATDITTLTNVMGTVTSSALASWTLEFRMIDEGVFRPLASGTTPVTNGVLGVFDPTLLLNGIALIQLRATDTAGQTATAGPVSVVVTKNQKVGLFTVSFNDLSVPVAGLPIQVVRTYDSRNHSIGDFGVGWTLDLKTIQLRTNGALGEGWVGTVSGSGLSRQYCVQPTRPHFATLTMSDGTTYEFDLTAAGACTPLQPPTVITFNFTPKNATPPNASLAIVGNNQPFFTWTQGTVTFFDINAGTFDPDLYNAGLPDGRVAQIGRQSGLQTLTDPNGNKLTVTANGITHSSGKAVTFVRDTANRIAQIIDPAGNLFKYGYDATNNLVSFTDPLNNTSSYGYNSTHGLLTITDPRGIQPIRNDYDASGRLISHTDAFGKTITYTHNLATRQEVVTDRLNNVTVNEYDTDGNIVKVTDAMGGVTQRSYDSRGNVLSETNALGKTRNYTYDQNNNRLTEQDPLGHTTTYTYNSRNQVLTITDALNRLTTNTYDGNGNLTSAKDPAGNVTSYTYNAQGLRTSMIDPLNNVTQYEYDTAGNLTKQTDPLGNVTTYQYDANGNKTSETRTRTTASGPETLTTSYVDDKLNRLTQITYPDGSTTQIQYNAIGKQSVTIDQLNRQTTYQYDLMGRLIQTSYPDGTSESSGYDAEGNRTTSIDRATRTTTYVYDALKRLTQTIYPDTASTSTAYDFVGQVTSVKDPLGNVTQYQYDDAGRRTKVIDALNHVTSFNYDQVANQSQVTDANGYTTQYQYDANNRRIKVIYPDTTSVSTAYDALGRTISKTDQAGKVTQFQYDKLGRLTQVTDALNQLTKYSYDEVGNRISQTDADNHTTTFAYDKLGSRIKRTLPLGMAETSTYDAAGNLKTKTDFNGKTTTYNYDPANRLTSKVPDASFAAPTVSFTYTATGQRLSMVDASGTTSYAYDLRDRLTLKMTPRGSLSYTYDAAGNLASIRSSNTGGTSVDYFYDPLTRLASARDNRLASGTTTYSYDNAGNLQGHLYPNGIQSTYQYDTLNRLTSLSVTKGTTLASYAYQLGPAGNRTQVTELGGRVVTYGYDNLYRLTQETIAGVAVSGTIGYQYDQVGNRLQRTSTVAAVPAAAYTYDANDRLTTDTYDATLVNKRRQELITAGDRERLWVSTNLGYMEAMHDATNVEELFDLVRGRYECELLRQFNLQHAKNDPGALASNLEKKTQNPSLMERRVARWDNFVKLITATPC